MNFTQKLSHEEAMQRALLQARRGLGRVSPNPPVGVVILDKERCFLAEGFHQFCGEDHAEIMALKKIKDKRKLEKAILYTTLEPCSFQGKTPSCAKELAKLPFSKIYVGVEDPHPKVQGQGIKILKEASIEVEMYKGDLMLDLQELIEIFFHNVTYKKPFISLKIASSLDGKIAHKRKNWITGEESRKYVGLLRAYHDAVCIGVNTFIEDNPRLNIRHEGFLGKKNYVIILDPQGLSFDFLKNSKLTQIHDPSRIIIVTTSSKKKDSSHLIIEEEVNNKGLYNLDVLLQKIFDQGISSILVEGGGKVFESFFRVSQRLYLFLAPVVVGKTLSVSWNQDLDILKSEPLELKQTKWISFGQDRLVTGRMDI